MTKTPHTRRKALTNFPVRTIPQIALLLETSREFGRAAIRGISNYAKAYGPWNFFIHPGDINPRMPPSDLLRVDAVIGRISSQRTLSDVLARNVPIVSLGYGVYRGPCYVKNDPAVVGRLPFEYLRNRGFSRFAFCGLNTEWGNERRNSFFHDVHAQGMEFHNFEYCSRKKMTLEQQLGSWLVSLPKPVGLLAQDDLLARIVIEVSRCVGVLVPEHVAVIGVDNDELICNVASPTLSSLSLNAELMGFHAAKAMNSLLVGADPGPTVLIEPVGVISRQSTDTVGVDDPVVAGALRFIRAHAAKPIGVPDLVRHGLVSRRTLEKRFEKVLGRSPYEEIERSRLSLARELLINSDIKISTVAQKSGFSGVHYMHQVFRRRLGQTPGRFRATNRPFAR